MNRPYVVCHMLTSLDGKIDGSFFGSPETEPALAEYGNILNNKLGNSKCPDMVI